MSRGAPIHDGTARNLLVLIRQGRLHLTGVLADHLEEIGDPRGDFLRIVLKCYDSRLQSYGLWYGATPAYRTAQWNWLRTTVGNLFGRRWQWVPYFEVAELMKHRWR
jgi:hypothetical protein